MSKIYYNFEKQIISGVTTNSLGTSIVAKTTTPITNIKYDDVAYFVQNIYFYKPAGARDTYLVVQHIADPNGNSGKVLYLAAKIGFNGSTSDTDIDIFLKASATPANLDLTLNNYIKDGGDAHISTDATTKNITITLESPIPVKAASTSVALYRTVISDLGIKPDDPSVKNNAVVLKSILDWSISCEMEGEDMENQTAVATKSSTSDLMDNINMVMAFVLTIGGMYMAAPEIYNFFILPIVKSHGETEGKKPIASLNLFWNLAILLLIIEMIVFGAAGKGSAFYILAIGLILMIFSIDKSLEDSIGEGKSLFKAQQITVHNDTYLNDPSYTSIFTNPTDDTISMIVKGFCVLSMLGIWGSNFNMLADENITNDQAIKQYLVSFPNYFMYGITLTIWSHVDNEEDFKWKVAKWAALLGSMGWFVGSMFTIFKK
jgi:hypothetical protein